jgi:hypothetical protein
MRRAQHDSLVVPIEAVRAIDELSPAVAHEGLGVVGRVFQRTYLELRAEQAREFGLRPRVDCRSR